ncbi:MAG: serine/threonine-protein phosphatase [Planctomycetia bacterium]|nr:serine/threonine-protein phosphatase [Planctomycetia bacterium]
MDAEFNSVAQSFNLYPETLGPCRMREEATIRRGRYRVTRFDQIEHGCLSDVGVRRSHNQDNYAVQLAVDDEGWKTRGHLFLVADGMGAHAVGEKASEQAAHIIPHIYQKHATQGPVPGLRKAFVEANASIHSCGQLNREFEGMGTTGTALLLRPDGAWVGHVGDSRCYRIRNGIIEQLSYDHSLVWEYARLQHIDPDEVEDVPSNVIHRCLGPEPLVQVDVEGPHDIQPGDVFLLCSDGLSGPVSDAEMGAVVSVLPPAEACRFLVDLANLRGGPDNITAIVVRVLRSAEATPKPPSAKSASIPLPWWSLALLAGTLCAVVAAGFISQGWTAAATPTLGLAVLCVVGGLVGLGIHYRYEQTRPEEETQRPPAVPHRKRGCKIERPLLDRLVKALKTLQQMANDNGWKPDWSQYDESQQKAQELLTSGDVSGAFREYCRAMLPLTRALQESRNKEEVFRPVWDKTR